jgi:hypothetical protein
LRSGVELQIDLDARVLASQPLDERFVARDPDARSY